MKNETCPNCDGMLGVPDKLRGLPVECPVCHLEFVPGSSASKKRKKNAVSKSSKPSLRSVPLPAAISTDSEPPRSEKTKYLPADNDHLMPPKKSRLSALTPDPQTSRKVDQVEPTVNADADKTESVEPRQATHEPVAEVVKVDEVSAETVKPAIARIIKTELVQPQLTKDGKLPTLQLVDEAKPNVKEGELKSNPVFIGLLICFSLLTSGVMLVVVGTQPSQTAVKVQEARTSIRDFYEVRIDEEVAPFQRELREAQLANSRGDYRTEIRNYEKVMARFHAEDRNKFKGLTGSPTADVELEEYVSTLLNEAKRRLRKGL